MEEIYLHILHTVFGILSLVGIVWGALRCLVKYNVFRASHEARQYTDGKLSGLWDRVHEFEAELYDLNIALARMKERLVALEKESDIEQK